jgi:hypothetical protein
MMKGTALIALAISASVILTGCSSSQDANSDESPAAAEAASTEQANLVVVLPQVGDCWDQANLSNWVLDGTLALCGQEHNGQTVWVGELPASLTENPFTRMEELKAENLGPDGEVNWDEMSAENRTEFDSARALLDIPLEKCNVALNKLIGANSSDGSIMFTIFSRATTGPSDAEWANGARWIRCNAIAKVPVNEGQESAGYLALPQFLEGVMRTRQGLQFNYCYQRGGKRDGDVAICGTPEAKGMSLIISTWFPQVSEKTYVGRKWAYQRAGEFCRDAVENYWNGNSKAQYAAWGLYVNREGDRVEGFSKSTWGTEKANFACSISQGSYQHPSW